MLTKVQIKTILILMDNEGHAEVEIADILDMERSNLNPKIKKLEKQGIIRACEERPSRKAKEKNKEYKEKPWFLSNNLDGLKHLIEEVAKLKRVFEAFFVLEIIENSRYIESMVKRFGEDVNKAVNLVLNEYYPAYSDLFFNNIIRPNLVWDLWDCAEKIESEKRLSKAETQPETKAKACVIELPLITKIEDIIKIADNTPKPKMPWELQYLEIVLRNNDSELRERLMQDDYMRSRIEYLNNWKSFY
jgi:predicted transcriptional regulator